jgi:hypothetical protein
MDTFYELTEAECEMVAGGGDGQFVAARNLASGTGPGQPLAFDLHNIIPGSGAKVGPIVSGAVHRTMSLEHTLPSPDNLWGFHFT